MPVQVGTRAPGTHRVQQRLELGLNEHLLAVEKVDVGVGHLPVDQQQHAGLAAGAGGWVAGAAGCAAGCAATAATATAVQWVD